MVVQALEVYYDDRCGLCSELRQKLQRWDYRHRLHWISLWDPQASAALHISQDQLATRLYVRKTGDGKVAGGVWALVEVSRLLPILWPLIPLLTFSGYLGFGSFLYDWIAARRYRLLGKDFSCPANASVPLKH